MTVPERLLTALDDCLDAMLSGAPGPAEGQYAYGELGSELEPLLAVAGELMRSREWIDERLVSWQESLPMIAYVGAPGKDLVHLGRWPWIN
jgi:hypothetical protein